MKTDIPEQPEQDPKQDNVFTGADTFKDVARTFLPESETGGVSLTTEGGEKPSPKTSDLSADPETFGEKLQDLTGATPKEMADTLAEAAKTWKKIKKAVSLDATPPKVA